MENKQKFEGGDNKNNLPPVRNSDKIGGKENSARKPREAKIHRSDYKAWDNYDVDGECEKVDIEDPVAAAVTRKKEKLNERPDVSKLSEIEIFDKAQAEKDKGNEAFKAGDFDEALLYYSRSINIHPTTACINNRALVYIRKKKWLKCLHDCDHVLRMEPGNLKAMMRRATACKELGKLVEAQKDLEYVLKQEPLNKKSEKLLEEVLKLKEKVGRRMTIVEDDSSEEEIQADEVPVENNKISEVPVEENKINEVPVEENKINEVPVMEENKINEVPVKDKINEVPAKENKINEVPVKIGN